MLLIKVACLLKFFMVFISVCMLCLCAQSLQSCPTLCDSVDWSPPGSSVLGVLQARILEWFAMSSSRGSSGPRDWTWVSCVFCCAGRFFTTEPQRNPPICISVPCNFKFLSPTFLLRFQLFFQISAHHTQLDISQVFQHLKWSPPTSQQTWFLTHCFSISFKAIVKHPRHGCICGFFLNFPYSQNVTSFP